MSLSLKDAFRTMNFMDSTITALSYYIKDTNNAVKVVEKHNKKNVNPDAEDVELDMTTERMFANTTLVDIIFLTKEFVNEKSKLSVSIENAKRELKINNDLTLDSAIETAKKNRDLANTLKTLVDIKSAETKKIGNSFKFNINGEQVKYQYEIISVKTIDFDRNIVNEQYKKLLDKADKLSNLIENAMLKECVNYEFSYSIHDSVTDIVEKYIASKAGKEE
jgi:hypothetical protein